MPDDHSKLVPLLPIPNRTVKRLCADDSAGSRVKVGHRQALIAPIPPSPFGLGGFALWGVKTAVLSPNLGWRQTSLAPAAAAALRRVRVCSAD